MPACAHTGFCPNTHRGCIAGKSHCDTAPPTRALVCHLVLPCATNVAHARHVRHSLCPAILLFSVPCHCIAASASSALLVVLPNQKLRGTWRHPGGLGTEQTLSPVVRVFIISFEHKASESLFYTRYQNPYTVST